MFNNRHQFGSDNRGQLLLVGGIMIAMLLVILVLILNGVLYTENIATREQPQAIDRGVDLGSTVEGASSDLIDRENQERYENSGTAALNVETDLEKLGELLNERQFEAHGELVGIQPYNVQPAWVVVQEEESDFTSADQPLIDVFDQWEMATANGVRDGTMSVSNASSFDPSEESEASDVFRLDVTGEDNQWSIWVFDHPTQNGIAVTDRTDADGNPDLSRACTSTGTPAEIDLVEMTVNGEECEFSFAEDVGDGLYQIDFNRGDEIEGTYEFTLGQGDGADLGSHLGTTYVRDTTSGEDADSEEPTAYDGVYGVTAILTIHGQDVELESYTYAAPDQPAETTSSVKP